jgi:hypothetical protein
MKRRKSPVSRPNKETQAAIEKSTGVSERKRNREAI